MTEDCIAAMLLAPHRMHVLQMRAPHSRSLGSPHAKAQYERSAVANTAGVASHSSCAMMHVQLEVVCISLQVAISMEVEDDSTSGHNITAECSKILSTVSNCPGCSWPNYRTGQNVRQSVTTRGSFVIAHKRSLAARLGQLDSCTSPHRQ